MKGKLCLIIAFFLVSAVNGFSQVNQTDSLALVDFYNSVQWREPFLSSGWDLNTPVGTWQGITVMGNRVTQIQLYGATNGGKIPSSFGNLTGLTNIMLLDCKLTDTTLPASFSNLTNLTNLKMSAVFWYLPFPDVITQLPNLKTLDLQDNFFTTMIPASVGTFTNLTGLTLSNCFINVQNAAIPAEIGNLSTLETLSLNDNGLTGEIPASFAGLANINTLDLSGNQFSGIIPLGLNSLSSLNYLMLNNNMFTFEGLEPFISNSISTGKTYTEFNYLNQKDIQTIRGQNSLYVITGGNAGNNTYNWYDSIGTLLNSVQGDSSFRPSVTGIYHAEITNSIVSGLTLNSAPIYFSLEPSEENITVTKNIQGSDPVLFSDDFSMIATLQQTGASPVNGNVTSAVTIEPDIIASSPGFYFVRRHYDIMPENNASTSTARVTLYFTQKDFDNYNNYVTAHNLNLPLLPSGGVDNGNARIMQIHGSFSGGSLPDDYSGEKVWITPAVTWKSAGSYWEVSFEVSGFSGFFLTSINQILAFDLLDFGVIIKANQVVDLVWTIEQDNTLKNFIIQRQENSVFADYDSVKPKSLTGITTYSYTDTNPNDGVNLYRLKITDWNGVVKYSKARAAKINLKNSSIFLFPNPASNILTIRVNTPVNQRFRFKIVDGSGRVLIKSEVYIQSGISGQPISISKLQAGTYYLQGEIGDKEIRVPFIKK